MTGIHEFLEGLSTDGLNFALIQELRRCSSPYRHPGSFTMYEAFIQAAEHCLDAKQVERLKEFVVLKDPG